MLEVNNLKISANDKILVDNVSFKLNRNETLGIIGVRKNSYSTFRNGTS